MTLLKIEISCFILLGHLLWGGGTAIAPIIYLHLKKLRAWNILQGIHVEVKGSNSKVRTRDLLGLLLGLGSKA